MKVNLISGLGICCLDNFNDVFVECVGLLEVDYVVVVDVAKFTQILRLSAVSFQIANGPTTNVNLVKREDIFKMSCDKMYHTILTGLLGH